MPMKKCAWCGFNMRVKKGEEGMVLHKDCYKKHFVPVKHKYKMPYFITNIDKMKEEEKATLERCSAILADISLDDIKD